ncbi:hypothetical protein [Bordetella bronchiseptica]|uniref:hypothetical protein n=1 Tax=Bordetella bronchiseptica TaxID=518 RepID=UPI000460D90D|nr:hypothetical protein [Bordetella bronchiseptica]KDD18732.1 hypothetical protein L522_4173 [Bordetella bronchiseptica MBORD707]
MTIIREDTAMQQCLEISACNAFENKLVCALETGNRAEARRVYAEAQDYLTQDSLDYLGRLASSDYGVDVRYD